MASSGGGSSAFHLEQISARHGSAIFRSCFFVGCDFARAVEQLLGAFAYAFMPCSARARLCVESEMPGNLEARLDILEAQGVTILDRRQIYLDEAVDLRRIRAGAILYPGTRLIGSNTSSGSVPR